MGVALFRVGGVVCHIGLCIGSGWMLHCLERIDTVAERLDGVRWARRLQGFYRYAPR
jgi:hypothetical protein